MNNPAKLNLLDRLKFLAKDSAVYGSANAISKLVSLISFPIITRYYSVVEYGIIDAFTVLSNLLIIIIVFGQDSAVVRFFHEHEQHKDRAQMISHSLGIQLLLSVVAVPCLLLFADIIAQGYANSDEWTDLVYIIAVQTPFGVLINFSANILKINFKRKEFLMVHLGSTITYLLGILLGIYLFDASVQDLFVIMLVSKVAFGLLGLVLVRKWLTYRLNHHHYKELLRFGVPYGVICSVAAFLPALDRFFITWKLTEYDLGIYAAGYKVAFLIQLPIAAFETAWTPFYMALFKEKDSASTYNSVATTYAVLLCICLLGMSLFGDIMLTLLASEKYVQASIVIFPLIIGLVIQSVGGLLGIGIDLSKKSYLKIYSYMTGLLCTSITIYFLIEPFGIVGVAIGFVVGYIMNTFVQVTLAYRVFHLRFNLRPVLIAITFSTAIYLVATQIQMDETLIDVAIRVGLLIMTMAVFWFSFLKKEFKMIRETMAENKTSN